MPSVITSYSIHYTKLYDGGLPVGAFGGKKEIMEKLSPEGGVYQAGTLSGNPLAMSAGIATLTLLKQEGFYDIIEQKSAYLCKGLAEEAKAAGVPTAVAALRSGARHYLVIV